MQNKDACTSIMVGKKASLDGANYIARNEDRVKAIEPKQFLVKPAVKERHETYVSPYNKVTIALPEEGMRYTSTPTLELMKQMWQLPLLRVFMQTIGC